MSSVLLVVVDNSAMIDNFSRSCREGMGKRTERQIDCVLRKCTLETVGRLRKEDINCQACLSEAKQSRPIMSHRIFKSSSSCLG